MRQLIKDPSFSSQDDGILDQFSKEKLKKKILLSYFTVQLIKPASQIITALLVC